MAWCFVSATYKYAAGPPPTELEKPASSENNISNMETDGITNSEEDESSFTTVKRRRRGKGRSRQISSASSENANAPPKKKTEYACSRRRKAGMQFFSYVLGKDEKRLEGFAIRGEPRSH